MCYKWHYIFPVIVYVTTKIAYFWNFLYEKKSSYGLTDTF